MINIILIIFLSWKLESLSAIRVTPYLSTEQNYSTSIDVVDGIFKQVSTYGSQFWDWLTQSTVRCLQYVKLPQDNTYCIFRLTLRCDNWLLYVRRTSNYTQVLWTSFGDPLRLLNCIRFANPRDNILCFFAHSP